MPNSSSKILAFFVKSIHYNTGRLKSQQKGFALKNQDVQNRFSNKTFIVLSLSARNWI